MIDDLQEELLIEILIRLPVKSIAKSSCVCKTWYSLVKSHHFCDTHLEKYLISDKNHLFFRHFRINGVRNYSLCFDNKDLDEYLPLNPPFKFDCLFLAACNGLICLYPCTNAEEYKGRIILWNPSIRKSLLLSSARSSVMNTRIVVRLGYDSRTHDYKVLRMIIPITNNLNLTNFFETELYSLNSNSWKVISSLPLKYALRLNHNSCHVFVNGATHCIVNGLDHDDDTSLEGFDSKKCFIIVFDYEDEVFRQIALPECLEKADLKNLSLMVFGKSLAAVHRDIDDPDLMSDIWVMEEYGVVSSWVQLATVGKHYKGKSEVLAFRNNGEVLMEFERGGLASLNLTSLRIEYFNHMSDRNSHAFYKHFESLALLDKGDDAHDTRSPEGTIYRKSKRTRTHI